MGLKGKKCKLTNPSPIPYLGARLAHSECIELSLGKHQRQGVARFSYNTMKSPRRDRKKEKEGIFLTKNIN